MADSKTSSTDEGANQKRDAVSERKGSSAHASERKHSSASERYVPERSASANSVSPAQAHPSGKGSSPKHAAPSKRSGKRGGKRKRKRLPRWADRLITLLVILVGVGLMVWPWVLDRLEASGVFNQISTVSSAVDAMDQSQKDYYLSQARAYNEVLAGQTPEIDPNQILPYDQQLTFDRDPMMSWVEIPSINVGMPIYHGTSDSALMAGVGHLEGTSLPVGGASTHTVLTAHSGMSNLRMFDDIRDLRPGDLVLLHTMGEVLAYKVDSSEVVWPDDVSSLGIQDGQDLLTLVTCTPYGVNDHRLLVHCERTDYNPEEAASQGDLQNRHWGMREWAVLITVLALLAVGADVIIHRLRQKHRQKQKQGVQKA
ncbi:MAG: class C sortase [Coriobacteriales bacterium]|nr:class C sortase [Coriobacteriales bacterium]